MSKVKIVTETAAGNAMPEPNGATIVGANGGHLASQEVQIIPLEQIRTVDKYRFRVQVNEKIIADYMGIYEQYIEDKINGKEPVHPFKPIYVLREKLRGKDVYNVIDGWHRFKAAQKVHSVIEMPCIVFTDHKEAIRIGLGSNRHGLLLNNADRAHCIKIAVAELSEWSNRMIADIIGCSESLVRKVVKKHELRTGAQFVSCKDGSKRPASPSKKRSKSEQQQENPAKETNVPSPPLTEIETKLDTPLTGDPGLSDEVADDVGKTAAEGECQEPVEPQEGVAEVSHDAATPTAEPETEPAIRAEPVEEAPEKSPVKDSNEPSILIDELKGVWESHRTTESDQWAEGVVDAFKHLYDALPVEYRKMLRLRLQPALRNWAD